MTATIFARTRHVYESYADFWRVVELSGYPTCYIDEIDASSDALYIIPTLNGEVGNGWPGARARIVHWNLEWCEYPRVPGIDERWHMDAAFAARCGLRYVPVGGHDGLLDGPVEASLDELIDLAYMGYMTGRRQMMAAMFDANALRRTPSSVWGAERHTALLRSVAYAHVHQHDDVAAQGVPALRMIVAAAYHMPVLCERVANAGIFGGDALIQSDYNGMADLARVLVRQKLRALQDSGDRLHWLLCAEHTFRKEIEAAV